MDWETRNNIKKVIRLPDDVLDFIKTIAEDDHNEQTREHQPFKYGGICGCCEAEKLLKKYEKRVR